MIVPCGEGALLVELQSVAEAQALHRSLAHDPIPDVIAVVPGLASVLVEIDPLRADAGAVTRTLLQRLAGLDMTVVRGRHRVIPVAYGGAHGPDLEEVASRCDLSPDAVIELHCATELRVLLAGFAPGFAYLGDLPPALHVPRLGTPRTRTPAGSVALAGSMSGIYPAELPGGWRIIGRTPLNLFDPRRDSPAYLAPGDTVRFEPMPAAAWPAASRDPDDW